MATLNLELGVPVSINAAQLAELNGEDISKGRERVFNKSNVPGLTTSYRSAYLSGTPTSEGTYSQEYGEDELGYNRSGAVDIVVRAAAPPIPEPIPDAEGVSLTVGDTFNRTADEVAESIGLTNDEGAMYEFDTVLSTPPPGTNLEWNKISGTVTTPGEYNLRVFYAVLGVKYQQTNYRVRVDPAPTVPVDPDVPVDDWARTDPHPDSEKLLTMLGYDQSSKLLAMADEHLVTVTTFVYGYTRGRGFEMGGFESDPRPIPMWDLRRVILSSTARSLANSQSLRQYSVGDYSETPSVFTGWTLPEVAVLHRYRRRTR